jgi:pyruvate formate lyase activating enzyme
VAENNNEPPTDRTTGVQEPSRVPAAGVVNPDLASVLDRLTVPGELCHPEGNKIRCVACGHRCLIAEGRRGICKVRFNQQGVLQVPFGYVAGLQCDPVEKKPYFHVFPGSDALTFGMLGCDFHCSYCQNWVTSQALRDPASLAPARAVSPQQLVAAARRQEARLVVSSYNEPLITGEWAKAVFEVAVAEGFTCGFVSNGNATPEALDYIQPWIRAYKVDLKCFNDANYRKLGGVLENVKNTIRMVHERGLWLEVLTLLVPGFNNSDEELHSIAAFITSISPDIPWHVTAFHKDYKMTDPDDTSAAELVRAAEIGAQEGLKFVYAGNKPGQVGQWENTRCPQCRKTLIERFGYLIQDYQITPEGACPFCRASIPGIWPVHGAADVRIGQGMEAYHQRLPKAISLR